MEYIKLITEYIKGIMEYFHWITCSTLSGSYCTVLYIRIYWVHTVMYHAVVHCLSWRRNSWSDSTMRFSGLRWNGEIRVPLPLFLLYSKTHWSSKSPSPKNLIIYIYICILLIVSNLKYFPSIWQIRMLLVYHFKKGTNN